MKSVSALYVLLVRCSERLGQVAPSGGFKRATFLSDLVAILFFLIRPSDFSSSFFSILLIVHFSSIVVSLCVCLSSPSSSG